MLDSSEEKEISVSIEIPKLLRAVEYICVNAFLQILVEIKVAQVVA